MIAAEGAKRWWCGTKLLGRAKRSGGDANDEPTSALPHLLRGPEERQSTERSSFPDGAESLPWVDAAEGSGPTRR